MRSRRAAAAALLTAALFLALPAAVVAHAELETSSPGDEATIVGAPPEIVGEFSAALDPARSSMELRGPDGARIARGGVPAGGPATRMTIADLPSLAPGVYEVRWTTVTPDDDGVERGSFSFTIAAATPAPTAAPPTAPPPTPTLVPTATPAVSITPATPPAIPASTPTPDPGPTAPAGPGDALVPLVALGAVLAAGAAWLLRRRR